MPVAISCKEVGLDCEFVSQMDLDFVTQREAEEVVIDTLIRHVQSEHTDDRHEIEEIYQSACKAVREKAA